MLPNFAHGPHLSLSLIELVTIVVVARGTALRSSCYEWNFIHVSICLPPLVCGSQIFPAKSAEDWREKLIAFVEVAVFEFQVHGRVTQAAARTRKRGINTEQTLESDGDKGSSVFWHTVVNFVTRLLPKLEKLFVRFFFRLLICYWFTIVALWYATSMQMPLSPTAPYLLWHPSAPFASCFAAVNDRHFIIIATFQLL